MSNLCYRRFNNGTYLLTCGESEGHEGVHREMDGAETWPADAGWSDEYTGAPVKYDPDRVAAEPAPPPEPEPEPEPEQPPEPVKLVGCFNCRQGHHERCAFPPEFCPCKRTGHGAKS